jgi:hypothetical protein
VQAPRAITSSREVYGEHPLLAGLAKYLNIPHNNTVKTGELAGAFAWLDQPETIWPVLSKALADKQLEELVLIDFPNGKMRERIFTARDLYKRSWAFWKKAEPLTWKEIIAS